MKLGRIFSLVAVGALAIEGCVPNHPVEALASQLACSYKDGVHRVSNDIPVVGDEVMLGGYPAQSLLRLQNGSWVIDGFLIDDQLVSEGRPASIRTGSDIFEADVTLRVTKEGDVARVSVGCVGVR